MADLLTEQNLMANDLLSNQSNDDNSFHSENSYDQSTQKISTNPNFMNNGLNQLKVMYQRIQSHVFYLKDEKINYRFIIYFIFFLGLLIYFYIDKNKSEKRKIMFFYENKYQIEIKKYNISYDINQDSSMKVTENITISYQGVLNTGFRRFIPVDNGVQIRNVQIHQITEKGIQKVHYDIYTNLKDIIFDIGDYQPKYGKNESYFISYEFRILNKTFQSKNMMPINVIGHQWNCKINDAFIQLIIPTGFIEAKCYVGPYGTTHEYKNFSIKNKRIISMHIDQLKEYEGVTFNMFFEPKSINSYVDSSCYYYFIITIVILLIIIALSLYAQNKNKIIPIRYTYALNSLDPIIMSKVLNGSVKNSDVPSIIFYWASKGFLNINFDDENDPVLIKNDSIPDSFPSYQKFMFDELFKKGDVVKTLELKYKFYKTIYKVTDMVDSQTNKFTNGNSIILSLILAILGSISSIIAPLKMQKSISEKFDDYSSFTFVFFLIIIWFVRFLLTYRYIVDMTYIIESIVIVVLCFFSCSFYMTNIQSIVISDENKIALCILCEICVICSTYIITKTAYFKAKINEVYGFKEFITHPVNEEFESFLKKDPELFYNFICYAQVLNLSDAWKNKFENLTVSPPHWIVRSHFDNYYYNDYIWMYRRIHYINHSMVDNMIHSPPQERSNSFHSSSHSFGGGGGGFGGGGFGGGGGCGR